jgi:Icc protein
MTRAPTKILHISDTHLFSDKNKVLLKVPTQKSLEAVIELIKQKQEKFDFIIHSGDLSQDYLPPSYTRLAEMLAVFKVPTYYVPGNHDDTKVMMDVFPCHLVSNTKHIIINGWQLILLDSHIPSAVEGSLASRELTQLRHCLESHPDHHALTVFHHQPVPVGSHWLDNLGLKNADEFWKIVSQFPQFKAAFFGHVHQEFEQVVNGIPCYSAPSTCFQFARKKYDFGIEHIPPGYRWIHLYDDGRIETGIVRTKDYIGEFDGGAQGY